MSIKIEPCLAKFTPIDLNPNELHYYPFMISLDVMEVVWLLIVPLVEYVFRIKQKI